MLLSGRFDQAVDEKGRVAIPARIRKELSALQDEFLFVTRFKRYGLPCLDVYGRAGWLQLIQRLREKRRFKPSVQAFESWYVGAGQEVALDAQGRILIPPSLRDHARLEREAVIIGGGEKLHLWSRELHARVEREDERVIFDDPRFLEELDL